MILNFHFFNNFVFLIDYQTKTRIPQDLLLSTQEISFNTGTFPIFPTYSAAIQAWIEYTKKPAYQYGLNIIGRYLFIVSSRFRCTEKSPGFHTPHNSGSVYY